MTAPWTADFAITLDQAAQLMADACPDLVMVSLTEFGAGWDNTALLVNNRYVFRFPRRAVAAKLITTEVRVLPHIAPYLPLPIPTPLYAGRPAAEYPYPFAGYELIPGVTADRAALTDEERCALAAPLGTFLRQLHSIPVTPQIAEAAPGDEIGRTNLPARLVQLRERVNKISASTILSHQAAQRIVSIAQELAGAPSSTEPPCIVHGDLYARHLLVDDAGRLTGVIDWGDVHLGDAALDLAIAYSFLHAAARSEFFSAYGNIDVACHRRAQFRALHYAVIMLDYGHAIGDVACVAAGESALDRVLGG